MTVDPDGAPDRLRADVEALAAPGTRRVGSAGHAAARRYLVERAESLDLAPRSLPYDRELVNVVARLPGRDRDAAPVVLAAHYDTCGDQPGADDNAAAVAIVLEVASRLAPGALSRDLVLGLFDGEEPPHFLSPTMGSTHWYHHQRQAPVHAAVVLDLVGHAVPVPGAESLVAVTGAESDPAFPDIVRDVPDGPLMILPIQTSYVGDMSDYHVFRAEGRPFLFLSCGEWDHYHQTTDTPEKLDYAKMAAIVDWLLAALPRVCDAELTGPFESRDTLGLELEGARRHLGPMAAAAGLPLETREDLDALIHGIRARFAI